MDLARLRDKLQRNRNSNRLKPQKSNALLQKRLSASRRKSGRSRSKKTLAKHLAHELPARVCAVALVVYRMLIKKRQKSMPTKEYSRIKQLSSVRQNLLQEEINITRSGYRQGLLDLVINPEAFLPLEDLAAGFVADHSVKITNDHWIGV